MKAQRKRRATKAVGFLCSSQYLFLVKTKERSIRSEGKGKKGAREYKNDVILLTCFLLIAKFHLRPSVPDILPPLVAMRLCFTIASAAAAAASLSFCRLRSRR